MMSKRKYEEIFVNLVKTIVMSIECVVFGNQFLEWIHKAVKYTDDELRRTTTVKYDDGKIRRQADDNHTLNHQQEISQACI